MNKFLLKVGDRVRLNQDTTFRNFKGEETFLVAGTLGTVDWIADRIVTNMPESWWHELDVIFDPNVLVGITENLVDKVK